MTRLLIIGAGGHGKVVAEAAEAAGYAEIAFLDRDYPERTMNGRWPIVGANAAQGGGVLFCAVGDNAGRARLFGEMALQDSPVIIHPSAILSPSAVLGAGTLAGAGSFVMTDARIGRGVILNTGCSVDHDCVVEDFVHISPGARLAGGVHVGTGTWVGIGAVVREGVRIGRNAMIGAGAAVVRDIADGARVAGVPARALEA